MYKNKKSVQIGLGASSMLMIFVILCMMILSVLSYTQARQNEKIAKQEISYEEAYYKANTKAEIIYELLITHVDQYTTLGDAVENEYVKQALMDSTISYTIHNEVINLEIIVNKNQTLIVSLKNRDGVIEKNVWKLSSTGGQA